MRATEPDAWQILPPIRPGKSPLASLAGLSLPGEQADDLERPAGRISDRSRGAGQRVGAWADREPGGRLLLLVIDQFEELITLCWDAGEREQFLQLLQRALAAHPERLRVVLTLRSDFEPQFASSALEGDWMASRVVVPAMTLDEYREAIEGPASVKVLYFKGKTSSQEFINRLIGDVANTPGCVAAALVHSERAVPPLPATREATTGRCARRITRPSAASAGRCGTGPTRSTTDCPTTRSRETMRRVMLRMISVEAGEMARRRVPDDELVYREPGENERVAEVLRRLTEARLVVEGKETDDEPYVEPAHDELVRGWDRLLEWSRRDQEGLLLRRILTPAAKDWNRGPAGSGMPTRGFRSVRRVLFSPQCWFNQTESEFVRRSVQRGGPSYGAQSGLLLSRSSSSWASRCTPAASVTPPGAQPQTRRRARVSRKPMKPRPRSRPYSPSSGGESPMRSGWPFSRGRRPLRSRRRPSCSPWKQSGRRGTRVSRSSPPPSRRCTTLWPGSRAGQVHGAYGAFGAMAFAPDGRLATVEVGSPEDILGMIRLWDMKPPDGQSRGREVDAARSDHRA